MKQVLLHICCGPCGVYPVQDLKSQGYEIKGLYYNPNIHPYQEYVKRLESAQEMARQLGIKFFDEEYLPEEYFRKVTFHESKEKRCRLCYFLRLKQTAMRAKNFNLEGFTTSLLVSPWQKHELIKEIGEDIAKDVGVPFLYFDWRPFYSEGRRQAKEMGLYRQQYCGCIFSEIERYKIKR